MPSPDPEQADDLYRGFPDFSAWGELTATDLDLWSRFASSLEERRKTAMPDALKAAVEVAVRAAALDTGAIEGLYTTDRGFTMTVAVQGLAWQQMIEERGAGVRELFEAQLEAYELVLDAVTRQLPITEAWVRALHEKLCGPQEIYRVLTEVGWQEQELPKGEYKTRPNHVHLTDGSFHAYAPVDRVPDEMHRLLEQIRTPEFEAAHPVLQASYLHYAFVVIHPFADGNGRVARALASVFFYRAESIPLLIFANQRPAYIDALEMADRGDPRAVISFFQDRGIDTMQLVEESFLMIEAPQIGDVVSELKSSLERKKLDNVASRLLGEIAQLYEAQFGKLDLPQLHFSVKETTETLFHSEPSRYRPLERSLHIVIQGLDVRVDRYTTVSISDDPLNPFRFRLTSTDGGISLGDENPDIVLEVRLSDVHPEKSPVFELRLANWVQRQFGRLLSELKAQANP